MRKTLFLIFLLAIIAIPAEGQRRVYGLNGKPAPTWEVDSWINLPEGKTTVDIADYKGKVVYLYCFQSWCPGCHSRGFPTLQTLTKRYQGDDAVVFVAVQTVFEGFSSNTPERAKECAEKFSLTIPVGHSGTKGEYSKLMRAYRTGGTPWTIIIDREGIVRYNDFHIEPKRAVRLINELKKTAEAVQKDNDQPAAETQ